ncbi:hypothetical protein H4R19_000385 [Coemansia spiralis]|nr:hypothetical protein H4R19_000385 [Coemansia spiralis]
MSRRVAAVPHGANVDTAIGFVDGAVLHPLCAVLVVAVAYQQGSLASPWFVACILVLVTRASVTLWRRLRQPAAIDWAKQAVVLTGGAHGIGLGLAHRIGATGARLAVLDARARPDTMPPHTVYCQCDLADAAQVAAALARIEAELGTATILISNAGTLSPLLASEQSAAEIGRVLGTNLAAPMQLTQGLLPGMLRSAHAHIVFVSSALAFVGIPRLSTYTASKAGLTMFYESLKLELRHIHHAHHVKTSIFFPSKVQTGLFSGIRMPEWLSPELSTDAVVDTIYSALDCAQGGEVYMPVFANLVPLYMFAPQSVRDLANWATGSVHAMRSYTGHARRPPGAAIDKV